MVDWWKENGVPVYMAVSGYLGLIKPKSGGTKGSGSSGTGSGGDYGNLEDLARMFGDTGGLIQ